MAGQVAGAGLLRSDEATAMVEDGVWRRDTRGIRPTPELPVLRQPALGGAGTAGYKTVTLLEEAAGQTKRKETDR